MDYIIIGVIGVSVLFGFYRGFVSSLLNAGSGLVSFGLSFVLYPKLAAVIQGNEELVRTLMHYTDASSRIGNLSLATTNVVQMGQEKINEVLTSVSLPEPLNTMLQVNLESQVFTGTSLTTVNDYVSQTILQASINILCFVACFILTFIALSLLGSAIRAVFRLPVLKQLDWLAGGAFGLLRGLLLCLVVFTLVPLLTTMLPLDFIMEEINQSQLAPIFTSGNLIMAIMNGKL